MEIYYVDTNVFLRFLLKDNLKQYQSAKEYFRQAKHKEIQLILTTEIILEINYVLRKVYRLSRKETAEQLQIIVQTPYFEIFERNPIIAALDLYHQVNIDLSDLILHQKALHAKAKILTFDQDFAKIP